MAAQMGAEHLWVITRATGGDTMTIQEILGSVQFVVNQDGKRTAAVVNIDVWEAVLSLLEDIEDAELIRDRLRNWRTKEGWTRWEDFDAELASDAL
jgi:hypothetical protein